VAVHVTDRTLRELVLRLARAEWRDWFLILS
jgi:hypothetical protein